MALRTGIQEVPCSNLCQDTSYPKTFFLFRTI